MALAAPPAARTRQWPSNAIRRVAQLGWLAAVGTSLVLFVLSLPARWDDLEDLAAAGRMILAEENASSGLLWDLLSPNLYPYVQFSVEIALVVVLVLSAVIVVWHRWSDWMALFVSLAFVTYGIFITPGLDSLYTELPALDWPIRIVQTLGLGCALMFFYVFPDGRFYPAWTRKTIIIWWVLLAAGMFAPGSALYLVAIRTQTLIGGVAGISDSGRTLSYAATFIGFGFLMTYWVSALIAQGYRYRKLADERQRIQTRWIVVILGMAVLSFTGSVWLRLLVPALGEEGVPNILFYMVGPLVLFVVSIFIPMIIGVSILRHRLWGIDLVVNRTIVYSVVSAVLVAVYVGLVLFFDNVFQEFTGGNNAAIAASTLIIAAIFQPVRTLVQRAIDRQFFKNRYESQRILESFNSVMRREIDIESLSDGLVTVVQQAMKPATVTLWLREVEGEEAGSQPSERVEAPPAAREFRATGPDASLS